MPEGPPPRRRLWPLIAAGLFAALVAAAAGGLAWLAGSEQGLAAACALAEALSGGRLRLSPAGGRLLGPLHLREALWHDDGKTVRLSDFSLDWTPESLLSGRLEIARLDIGTLHLDLPPSKEPARPPASLRLPLALRIGEIGIGRLEKGDALLAERIAGRLESDGANLRLQGLQAHSGQINLGGEAEVQADPPFRLEARGRLESKLKDRPFALDFTAAGPLAAIALDGEGSGAVRGRLHAELTPFAAQPFSRLAAHLTGIDPAAWVKGAPAARLDLDADLLPQPGAALAVAGGFTVANAIPGRIDAGRLPVSRLAGRIAWQGQSADFTDLAAVLAGGGRLSGRGRLIGSHLSLALEASRIDAAALHARLRPTRLSGPISAEIDPQGQALAADLADPKFRLATRLTRRGDRLDIARLHLAAGAASLQASGHLDLQAGYRFAAEGELLHFDPSRFAKLPAAAINARFSAAGSLQPHPVLALKFDLHDSRFNRQPLAGRGDIDLDWPAVKKAEVSLVAGANHVQAHGAFGRPGDTLAADIDAPDLGPYGFEGGVQGRLRLAGTPAAPAVKAELRAERFGLPGVVRVEGLRLRAEVGARPADPLAIELNLAALDTPQRRGVARQVTAAVTGSRARHQLSAAALLAGDNRIALAAGGGLADQGGAPAWSGEIRELVFTPPRPEVAFKLQQPAALRLGKAEWSLGPAEVAGSEWQGRLMATAAGERLHFEATGRGKRLGEVSARLDARLIGAWKLAPDADWRGRVGLAAADLAWLGPLLGENWQTGGRLQGEVALAGTPAAPVVTGRLGGDGLGLAIPGQGLRLEHGRLQAELADNRLRLSAFDFDSALRPPPRPLVLAAGREVERLAAAPGRLEMRGEIGLGTAVGLETGVLDIRLDRFGAFQLPDQWVAVSGQGRVRWQAGSLGATASLRADAGWWELARLGVPKLSEDVVVRRPGGSRDKNRPPPTRPRIDLAIETDLGPRFYFTGVGLDTRLAGSLRLTAHGSDLPRATGSIRTVGGKFDAYGQKLAIERGILNFQGLPDNPALNVRALRKGLPVEAGVEVVGTVKNPVVRLVSDPELPEAEKLSWLVLGHGPEQAGSNDASTLIAAASGLLGNGSGGVVQDLQRRFGIEQFGMRRGQIGDTGERQATSRVAGGSGFDTSGATTGGQIVTVGKRISSHAVLSYEQALGRAESLVKLTVDLSHRLSVVGQAGSDNALDFFYTFTFGR